MNRPVDRTSRSALVTCLDGFRRLCGYHFPALGQFIYLRAFEVLPKRIDVQLLPGVRAELDTADGTQRATYWMGNRFEYPTPRVLKDWATPADSVFFDIGSNYGWFSFYLASQLPQLAVHAFEPNPDTFANLTRISQRNSITRIRGWNCALGDENSVARLRPGVEDSGHSTFGDHPQFSEDTAIEVPVKTFDSWREEAGLDLPSSPLWVAKIDVEGFELRVIRGMRQALLARAFRGLVVEFLPSTLEICGTTTNELFELLDSLGYEAKDYRASTRKTANKFFVPKES